MRQAGVGAGVSVWTLAGVDGGGADPGGSGLRFADEAEEALLAVAGRAAPSRSSSMPRRSLPTMEATPSSDFVDQSGVQPALQQRPGSRWPSYYEPPAVQHGPLYFEDEMENVGDGQQRLPERLHVEGLRWRSRTATPAGCSTRSPCRSAWWSTRRGSGCAATGTRKRPPLGPDARRVPCTRPVPTPFDLKCPEEQTADLAQLTGGPLPVTATPAAPYRPACRRRSRRERLQYR